MQGRRLVLAAAMLAVFGGAGTAQADPPAIVVSGGETQEAFDYTAAIRERVWVDADFDSDGDGAKDRIAVDIMRPQGTETGLKAPVIMDDSPYYSTLGRGNESQLKVDDANGLLAKWPLFLDNYFVPRGYAYVLAQMNGTGYTTSGCPMHGGPGDIAGEKSIVDWLNGRVAGYSYFVSDNKGLIGDFYVMRQHRTLENENALLESVLKAMWALPGMRRIEAQLMMLSSPLTHKVPYENSLRRFPRLFLEAPLDQISRLAPRDPENASIIPWSEPRQDRT
jgi:hypothetical protein